MQKDTQQADGLTSDLSAELGALTKDEIDLVRQWFNCVQDLNPQYLERKDFVLAKKIIESLGLRVPMSIIEGINGTTQKDQADKDATNYGIGFLVDDMRVEPSRVVIIYPNKD